MAKPKGTPPEKTTGPVPAVPAEVIRKVRIGSTVALLLAAGISARTLFQLGLIIGLPKQFAWMLPGAFDVYAYTSATVAASIPAAHPARGWAVWNARVALSFTMIGNSLVHALYLLSHGKGWSATDYALTAVSAIPPIIVERLLHLQTKIASDAEGPADTSVGAPVGTADDTPVPTARRRPEVPTTPAADGTGADKAPTAVPTKPPTAPKPAADGSTDRGADVIDMAAAGAAARRSTDAWAADALPVYRRYIDDNGTEPNAPQLAAALEAAGLGTLGASRARDVRKATEALHAATPRTATKPERAEAVS